MTPLLWRLPALLLLSTDCSASGEEAAGFVPVATSDVLAFYQQQALALADGGPPPSAADVAVGRPSSDLGLREAAEVVVVGGGGSGGRLDGHGPRWTGFYEEPACRRHLPQVIVTHPDLSLANLTAFGKCVWLVPHTGDNEAALAAARPPYDSRVFLVGRSGSGKTSLEAHEVYSVNPKEVPATKARVMTGAEAESIWERRWDLMGCRLRFGYVPGKRYFELREDGRLVGEQMDRLVFLSSAMNFTFDLVPAADGQFGALVDDDDSGGSWSGLVGMIAGGEVEAGATTISSTLERSAAVDFSPAIGSERRLLWVMPRDSQAFVSSVSALASMLAPAVWALAWLMIAAAVLIGALLGSRRGETVGAALDTLGHVYNQGSSDAASTHRLSARILSLTCLFFGIFFTNVFSARLASTLSVQRLTKEIASMEDVLRRDYDLYVPEGSSFSEALKRSSKGSPSRRLWDERVSKSPHLHPPAAELEELFMGRAARGGGGAAVMGWSVEAWIARDPSAGCGLYQVPLPAVDSGAYPLRKDWPYREALSLSVVKGRESGVFDRISEQWAPHSQEETCGGRGPAGDRKEFRSVDMGSLWQFFMPLPVGVAAAAAVAAAEMLRRGQGQERRSGA